MRRYPLGLKDAEIVDVHGTVSVVRCWHRTRAPFACFTVKLMLSNFLDTVHVYFRDTARSCSPYTVISDPIHTPLPFTCAFFPQKIFLWSGCPDCKSIYACTARHHDPFSSFNAAMIALHQPQQVCISGLLPAPAPSMMPCLALSPVCQLLVRV